jgi:hypothetical protein
MIDSGTKPKATLADSSTSLRSPAASRTIRITGWMISSMPTPWRLSSIVTESTMNGMSSETTSMTV